MKCRTLISVFSGSALVLAATTACGGSSNGDLFGGQAHGAAGSNAGGSHAGGSTSTGGSGTGATGGQGAGGTGTGGSSGNSAGGSGTGGSGTGGSGTGGSGAGGSGTGGMSGGGGTSGSGGSGGGSVACGSSTCTAGPDFCCYYVDAQQPACNPVGTKCSPSTDLYCDGPEDCPAGSVCCGQLVQVSTSNGQKTVYNEVRCAQTCDYSKYQREFCHNTSQCTGGRTCHSSQFLSAYKVCG